MKKLLEFGKDSVFKIKVGSTVTKLAVLGEWARRRNVHLTTAQNQALGQGRLVNMRAGISESGYYFVSNKPLSKKELEDIEYGLGGTFLVSIDNEWRLAMAIYTFTAVTGSNTTNAKRYIEKTKEYQEAYLRVASGRPLRLVVAEKGLYKWEFEGGYSKKAALSRIKQVYDWSPK